MCLHSRGRFAHNALRPRAGLASVAWYSRPRGPEPPQSEESHAASPRVARDTLSASATGPRAGARPGRWLEAVSVRPASTLSIATVLQTMLGNGPTSASRPRPGLVAPGPAA